MTGHTTQTYKDYLHIKLISSYLYRVKYIIGSYQLGVEA